MIPAQIQPLSLQIRHPIKAACAVFVALSLWGCDFGTDVRIVTVLPKEEPALLSEVELLEVWLLPQSMGASETERFELQKGEPLRIENLEPGTWQVEVRGFDATKTTELVYGRSRSFDIAGSRDQTVRVLLGRAFAFNSFDLTPGSKAELLRNLTGHAAAAYSDGNKNLILVTGGSRTGIDEGPTSTALVIDTEALTVQKLPPMGCARTDHTAFQVDLGDRTVIVIAGGEAGCGPSLELFDAAARTFETIEVGCAIETTAGAAAEIAIEGGRVFHTGNVIIPGAEVCRVNLDTHESATRASLAEGTISEKRRVASANPFGRLLVLDGHSLLVDDLLRRPVESQTGCYDSLAGPGERTWSPAARFGDLRIDSRTAELVPLRDEMGDFFAVGRATGLDGQGGDELRFALMTASECRVDRVIEGALPQHRATDGFTLSDIGTLGDAQVILISGGKDPQGNPLRSSALLFSRFLGVDGTAVFSTSSDQPGGGYAPRLGSARAGHAAATLPDDSVWILGGGAPSVEVFFRGTAGTKKLDPRAIEARAPLDVAQHPLKRRTPTLTAVTILDNSINEPSQDGIINPNDEEPPESNLLVELVTEALPGLIFHDTVGRFASEADFYFGLAQRGIGDELHPNSEARYQQAHCQSIPLEEPSNILSVERTEKGNVLVGQIDSKGELASQTSYTNIVDAAREQMRRLAAGPPGCAWRQMLRVGRDAVFQTQGAGSTGGRPTGVRLLVFVTAGDDCSQRLVPPLMESPSEEIITDCTSPAFDPYFGLPVQNEGQEDALTDLLRTLAWRPEDLIVLLVGNPNANRPCHLDTNGTELVFPRRLASIGDRVEAGGGAFLEIDACLDSGQDAPSFAQRSEALTREIEKGLMPLLQAADFAQSCVPAWLTDIRPTFEDDEQQHHPLPVPMSRSAKQRALAQTVEEAVSAHCRIVLHRDSDIESAPGGTSRVFHRFAIPLSAQASHWRVVPDAELDDACETGWVVSLAHDKIDEGPSPEELADDVEIHCLR